MLRPAAAGPRRAGWSTPGNKHASTGWRAHASRQSHDTMQACARSRATTAPQQRKSSSRVGSVSATTYLLSTTDNDERRLLWELSTRQKRATWEASARLECDRGAEAAHALCAGLVLRRPATVPAVIVLTCLKPLIFAGLEPVNTHEAWAWSKLRDVKAEECTTAAPELAVLLVALLAVLLTAAACSPRPSLLLRCSVCTAAVASRCKVAVCILARGGAQLSGGAGRLRQRRCDGDGADSPDALLRYPRVACTIFWRSTPCCYRRMHLWNRRSRHIPCVGRAIQGGGHCYYGTMPLHLRTSHIRHVCTRMRHACNMRACYMHMCWPMGRFVSCWCMHVMGVACPVGSEASVWALAHAVAGRDLPGSAATATVDRRMGFMMGKMGRRKGGGRAQRETSRRMAVHASCGTEGAQSLSVLLGAAQLCSRSDRAAFPCLQAIAIAIFPRTGSSTACLERLCLIACLGPLAQGHPILTSCSLGVRKGADALHMVQSLSSFAIRPAQGAHNVKQEPG
eukprot:365733-Chlamydomonas_euryale.AAC.11